MPGTQPSPAGETKRTKTMETKGFTLAAVAARVQKLDSTFTWKAYTALATLARVTGATKKVVEAKIFGTEKPSKDFNNAWSRAGHVYSRFYGSPEAAATVRLMGIDDAEKSAIKAIDDHMTALGVGGKNAYDLVIEFGSKEEIEAAAKAAADSGVNDEPGAAPASVPAPDTNVVPLADAANVPDAYEAAGKAFNALSGDDQVNLMLAYIDVADAETLNVLAQAITARMLAANEDRKAA